jgi:CRP-like cAMP-binding protein
VEPDLLLDRQRWRSRIELANAIFEYLDIWPSPPSMPCRLMVQRHRAGSEQARIAEQLGVSRPTVSKWIGRYRAEG